MMQPNHNTDDVNVYTTEDKIDTGSRKFFGLLFFLGGLGAMSAPIFQESSSHMIGFGLVFALAGVGLLTGRSGSIINRSDKTIIKWWGTLGFKKCCSNDISDAHQVHFSRTVRESSTNTEPRTFPVYRIGVECSSKQVKIIELRKYEDARQHLKGISKFLNLQVCDATSGRGVMRNHNTFELPLGDRRSQEGVEPNTPTLPEIQRVDVDELENVTKLTIPPLGFASTIRWRILRRTGEIIIPTSAVVFIVYNIEEKPSWGAIIAICLIFGVFALRNLYAIAKNILFAKRADVITINTEHTLLERRGVFGISATRIELQDIEDVEMVHGVYAQEELSQYPFLMVHSEKRTLQFGYGLKNDEIDWLRDLIHLRIYGANL